MKQILIIRKATGRKPLAITKSRRNDIITALRLARVQRPELVEFFLSGEFAASTPIPQSIIDNPARRAQEFPGVGFVVPDGSLGRAPKSGERDWQSTSQSILLWIKKYFIDTGVVRIDEISVIVVDDER